MTDDRQATLIKIAAVAVAAPRWIGALLEAEGVPLPTEWKNWWVIFAAVCAAGMALVEAGAFAYCFRAWRTMSGRAANIMAGLIAVSALSFMIVLAPYIAANVSHTTMATLLIGIPLAVWSVSVASSTILIIASVGYAQKKPIAERKSIVPKVETVEMPLRTNENNREVIGSYEELVETNKNRNGNGPVGARELVEVYGVPQTTAYRWVARYNKKEKSVMA